MSVIQRCAIAVTLVLAGVGLSAFAQRGGGTMGHSGGMASRSAPTFRGSATPAGRTGFMPTQPFGASSSSNSSNLRSNQQFAGRPAPAGYSGRSGDGRDGRDDRYRRSYRPFYGAGVPYGLGWIGPGYLGYPGIGFDDDYYAGQQPPPDSQAADYGPPVDQYGPPPVEQAAAPPAPSYRPAYQKQQPQYDPSPEIPVTLVFKDGRPTQQIQNYMVTRTTLYVQGQRLREIPVDQIDLAATEKLNLDAGVDFQIPATAR